MDRQREEILLVQMMKRLQAKELRHSRVKELDNP